MTSSALTPEEIRAVKRALRRGVGRYTYERASQLAGVPGRTLHHWARVGVFVPDFNDEAPKQWSYRDLVLVRFFVWLRAKKLDPATAGERTRYVRAELEAGRLDPESPLRSMSGELHFGDEDEDRFRRWTSLPGMLGFLDAFDMMSVAESLGDASLDAVLRDTKGPNLVRPSKWTSISPWVYGGEPCIRSTRLPSAKVWALHSEQGLDPSEIARLYPGVEHFKMKDAIELEARIRNRQPLAA